MAEVTQETIEEAIKSYIEPHMEKDLVSGKCVKNISIDGDKVKVDVVMGFPVKSVQGEIGAAVKSAVEAVDGVASCDVGVSVNVVAHSVQKSLKPIDNVKNIIENTELKINAKTVCRFDSVPFRYLIMISIPPKKQSKHI